MTEAVVWRDISSAPHEQRVLLGWWYDGCWIVEAGLASHGWRTPAISNMSLHGQATHWRPLPAPPNTPESAGTKSEGGRAFIDGDSVVIRFPLDAMQSALDGAWGMHIFDKRQKITDIAEFAKEFRNELNSENEQGNTLVHRMADKAFLNMMEQGAFGFDVHEDQSL